MSYARFGCEGSDVYLFPTMDGQYQCCGCLMQAHSFITPSIEHFLAHLDEHRKAGHHIPESAMRRIREDIAEVGR